MTTGLLLSGGMDSICIAYWKRPDVAFTVDYGQLSAQGEISAAKAVCESLSITHEIISVDCRSLGSGDLSGKPPDPLAPITEWWPFRNQLLLTLVGMRAIALGVKTLLFGSVLTDSLHADGTHSFFESMNKALSIQEGSLTIATPAIHLSTPELVKVSGVPQSILAWSHSCHVSNFACGNCHGCFKYFSVMQQLGYETD